MSKEAVEIIGGRERRRRWSMEEKLRIVRETQAPGECVRAVAARHDVYPSLLHNWRRQVREGRLGQPEPPSFVPVRLAEPAPLPDLESVPRQWKVVQTVREKFTCRSCESITQPPAPFYPIARGRAGPNLLALILTSKFCDHQPLNRQSDAYAREGIDLDVSTLADWVGACTATLAPLITLIRAHVMAAERIHGDDTTVPVLAKGKTITGRLWTYVRDDRPFAGPAPPAAMFFYSRDRAGVHPSQHLAGYTGILQADAYAGFNDLYTPERKPAPLIEAACWSHGRRKFFGLAQLAGAPLAVEAVQRIDAIFDIERAINGFSPSLRLAIRQQRAAPLVTSLQSWMRAARGRMSRHADG